MTSIDWLGMALLLSLAVALLVAFFLYLRTAYRKAGGAIAALYVVRAPENSDLEILKEAVNRVTR